MLAPNNTPAAEQQDNTTSLAALALCIRAQHRFCQVASVTALRHALNAGDALIRAQTLVSSGWKRWLRNNCFLGARTAQLYQQLARHRDEIEAEISRAPDLSLRAARRLIGKPNTKPADKHT